MLTHGRETLGPLVSILEIDVNVKWSISGHPKLPSRQVHVRHHAARTAAADSFKERKRRLYDFGKPLDGIALFSTERQARRSGNDKNAAIAFRLKLKNVSCVLFELLQVDEDDFTSGRLQTIHDAFSLSCIRD